MKASRHKTSMHAGGESDGPIVPTNQVNKAGTPAAEPGEERGPTKGNTDQTAADRTLRRAAASNGLDGVRARAKTDKEVRFTALLHHVNEGRLLDSYWALNPKAAPGVDRMTWQEYGRNLEERIADLHGRVHRGAYRAKPSKRTWIPKADGRQRPLGIASLEDKIVQQAIRTVLEQVYEADFCGFSYGFRPGRSQHDALDALYMAITTHKVNWVLDADIQGFFDAIVHDCLMKFIEYRIGDPRILRLIRKWLRAGVSDDGEWAETKVGTPQGAVISPLLANIYLHYVLDLWVEQWRKTARGEVIIVRYADDFVMGFQYRDDADRLLRQLHERMAEYGLKMHPDKTRLIEFGRFAASNRQDRGQGRPETFDFLGFTHCCGTTRAGKFALKRRSNSKRMRTKLKEIHEKLRQRMHLGVGDTGRWLRAVVQGWFNYHAVPGNSPALHRFRTQVTQMWRRTLCRRSQRGRRRWNWERMNRIVAVWMPPEKILHPYPNERWNVRRPKVRAV